MFFQLMNLQIHQRLLRHFQGKLQDQHRMLIMFSIIIVIIIIILSALINLFLHKYDKPSQPHYDLVHSSRLLIQQSPVQWTHIHVAGHQDRHTHYNNLDKWGQRNVDMDKLAKEHWEKLELFRAFLGYTDRSARGMKESTAIRIFPKILLRLQHSKT